MSSYHPSQDSCDESESSCGTYWPSRHAEPVCVPVPLDDGWSASRELSAPPGNFSSPQSSWQPFPGTNAPGRMPAESPKDTPLDVESLNAPGPSMPGVHEFIHSVQFGIMPKRLSLSHPDDEILCGYEEDVLSI